MIADRAGRELVVAHGAFEAVGRIETAPLAAYYTLGYGWPVWGLSRGRSLFKPVERDGARNLRFGCTCGQADHHKQRMSFSGMSKRKHFKRQRMTQPECSRLCHPRFHLGRLSLGGLLSSRARLRFAGMLNIPLLKTLKI